MCAHRNKILITDKLQNLTRTFYASISFVYLLIRGDLNKQEKNFYSGFHFDFFQL